MFALITASVIAGSLPPHLTYAVSPLAHLCWIDVAVICVYFAVVLFIGLYRKGKSNTGEDFFMAGCQITAEMTGWSAGLSFVSANPSARRGASSKTHQASAVDTGTPGRRPPLKDGSPTPGDRAANLPQPKNCRLWLLESSKYPSPYFFEQVTGECFQFWQARRKGHRRTRKMNPPVLAFFDFDSM